ncbi:MAG: RagB/SusD family nutrient uptake outer membrane protein [Clostridium sp.]|nr:RagB/SusD family nutrient uptake outer membrane protein [Clostridium sp.]
MKSSIINNIPAGLRRIGHLAMTGAISLTLAASFTACNDFLDVKPQGNNLEEDFYDTKYKLQAALNATYDILQSDGFQDTDWRFGEAMGDDVIGSDEGLSSHMGQLVNFRFTTSNTYILNRWTLYYQGIHRANQVIANIHRCRLSTDSYSNYREVREIYGQAKFLRALFYFSLVKTFGGVPIRPEVETVENLVIPRSTKEECYAYIEKDLREAAIMLQSRYTSSNSGKASAGAAVGLLMKVLMYQATPGVYSEKWEQAAELGDYFVKGMPMTFAEMLRFDERYPDTDWETLREELWFKPLSLNGPSDPVETLESTCPQLNNAYGLEYADAYGNKLTYDEQFYSQGEFCKGSVFEIVFKESGDGTTGDTNEGTGIYSTLFPINNFYQPIYADDAIRTRVFGSDVRTRFTIGHHEFTPDHENTEIGSGHILSLKNYTPVKDRPIYDGDSQKNRRYMRFAEVVLTYAEALNEVGRGADALEQLNSNKAQANTINNGTTLYVGGGYGYLRDQIWKEREIELFHEWDRFFDIVRQGRARECLQTFAATRSNHRGVYFREGVNEIFPIPQTEIDISNGVVTQNPGY